ncbi:hypothetical protein BDZ94DRAFT_1242096 [Collybia nuda]|uniref:Uncharacterized protein n=1 Tax=Collybia nuda TaxID=64659 RepID=A0A9P6CB32_9AGAR|nr:hypothetical protein BDZ94DRAFT_1242096 [Collybia nuda]
MPHTTSANTNAFGSNPNGIRAHLFTLTYGPGYLPDNYNHLASESRSGLLKLPPRFGPPAPHQIPWLPDPVVGHCNTKVKEGVFLITVTCTLKGQRICFQVPSDITWWKFLSEACRNLKIRVSEARLEYRHFGGIQLRWRGESGCYYSPRTTLAGENDWRDVLRKMRAAGLGNEAVEIDIFSCSPEVVMIPHLWHAVHSTHFLLSATLPDDALSIPTFCFDYPPLDSLLSLLESEAEGPSSGSTWGDENLKQAFRIVGLEFLDDFAIVSPRALYSTKRIPIELVHELYALAKMMLHAMNLERAMEIEEIEEMRKEGAKAKAKLNSESDGY